MRFVDPGGMIAKDVLNEDARNLSTHMEGLELDKADAEVNIDANGGGGGDKKKGLKPASSYDRNVKEDSKKFKEDWDYILNGSEGNGFTRFWDVVRRDWNASSSEERQEFTTDVATTLLPFKILRLVNLLKL